MYIFPYQTKIIDEGELIDPRVNLEIMTAAGSLTIKFLVDSGADVTTLPYFPYAPLFNFKKSQKDRITIGGIEGRGVAGYPYTLRTKLKQNQFRLRCYLIDSSTEPLLGRLDFWQLFSIHFNNLRKRTEFIPITQLK